MSSKELIENIRKLSGVALKVKLRFKDYIELMDYIDNNSHKVGDPSYKDGQTYYPFFLFGVEITQGDI